MLRVLGFVLALLCATTASADVSEHPLSLWRVEGAHSTIYLLGSVHLLRESDYPLPSAIEVAYAEADALVMEIDMDDLDPIASQALVTQLGVIHDGRTLRDLLGADLYAQAQRSALAMDIPLEMLAKSEPWLAAITIEQLALQRIGFNPMYGVEMYLMGKSVEDGKEITGLESLEEQLNFLDSLSIDAQRDLLMQTLAEGIDIQAEMGRLIDAWRYGDVHYLEQNMLADLLDYPELYAALVGNRNRRWVSAIESMLNDDQNYLIIVGALHLVGEDGVPELLSRQGIDVSQMIQPAD